MLLGNPLYIPDSGNDGEKQQQFMQIIDLT
jgi:hypothetical protein